MAIARRLAEPNVHRVAIVSEEGKLVGLVTQSALCEYIVRLPLSHCHVPMHSALLLTHVAPQYEEHYDIVQNIKERVRDLTLPDVLRVRETEEALVAFQLMLEKVHDVLVCADAPRHAERLRPPCGELRGRRRG